MNHNIIMGQKITKTKDISIETCQEFSPDFSKCKILEVLEGDTFVIGIKNRNVKNNNAQAYKYTVKLHNTKINNYRNSILASDKQKADLAKQFSVDRLLNKIVSFKPEIIEVKLMKPAVQKSSEQMQFEHRQRYTKRKHELKSKANDLANNSKEEEKEPEKDNYITMNKDNNGHLYVSLEYEGSDYGNLLNKFITNNSI